MNVDFAFICDYAEAKDKINAMGIGFDTIYAQKLPIRLAHFFVVAQLRFTFSEVGSHELAIQLMDFDGKDVIKPVIGKMEVGEPPKGFLSSTARFTMSFDGIEFKTAGDFSIIIKVNGTELVSIPLRVIEAPKNAPQ